MLKTLPMTLAALEGAFAGGLEPADLIAEVYRRIAEVDDPAIFLHLRDMAEVQAEAAALPPRSAATPLWGIPFAVKDNIDVAGLPTTAACPAFAYTAGADAFVVARLRAAGALVIGKTNLDQFATGLVGMRSPYGVPRNAVDPALVPGGSSSGSAVAVGHGLVPFALGTDTAGSGRVPAALNAIVGLKPSLGALSARGVVPACRTLDTISIFATSVPDAYAVFQAARAYDAADPYSRRSTAAPLDASPEGLRIGIPAPGGREFFGDAAQAAMFEAALQRLKAAGATLIEVDMAPFNAVAEMLYEGAWVAERYTVVEDLMRTRPEALHPTTARIIGAAEGLSAADAFRGIYRLKALERMALDALEGIDLMCVPTIPTFYTRDDLEKDPVTPNSRLGTYTNFVNLLDMCGIAVPTAPRADGRPGSVTLLGRAGSDGLAASVARVFATEAGGAAAARAAPRPRAGEMALAVCGAHMSALPLNAELTARGGRLLEATRTAPCYSLFALAGGPPARPGLLRVDNGRAIELEVWALPKTAFGEFLAGVPAPLSVGAVELADGRRVPGFLVEAAGLKGATDISALGGWRRYIAAQPGGTVPAEAAAVDG